MHYGKTFENGSINKWKQHDLDYNVLKKKIKEFTKSPPSTSSAINIPGKADGISDVIGEDELYENLCAQHDRINDWVSLKHGELQRKQTHIRKYLMRQREESLRHVDDAKRHQRYLRCVRDITENSHEAYELGVFSESNVQGILKLLKKWTKWSHSGELAKRFKENVFSRRDSLARRNFQPLMDSLNELQKLAEVLRPNSRPSSSASEDVLPYGFQSASKRLYDAYHENSVVDFDLALSKAPIGRQGGRAVYWVHPDNRLQLLLLLQTQRMISLGKANGESPTMSRTSPEVSRRPSTLPMALNDASALLASLECNTFAIFADDLRSIVRRRAGMTYADLETKAGVTADDSALIVRWTKGQDAVVSYCDVPNKPPTKLRIKAKRTAKLFDPDYDYAQKAREAANDKDEESRTLTQNLATASTWLDINRSIKPLVQICSKRSRFGEVSNDEARGLWAVLDENVFMSHDGEGLGADLAPERLTAFPFDVFEVRWESFEASDILQQLDSSHLVHRVYGFSIETHAIWHAQHGHGVQPPSWHFQLTNDIRKIRSTTGAPRRPHNRDAAAQADNSNVERPIPLRTETTAPTDSSNQNTLVASDHSLRKPKRTRTHDLDKENFGPTWNEYDNGSEFGDNDPYTIEMAPEGQGLFSAIWTKVGDVYARVRGKNKDIDVEAARDIETTEPLLSAHRGRSLRRTASSDSFSSSGLSSSSLSPEPRRHSLEYNPRRSNRISFNRQDIASNYAPSMKDRMSRSTIVSPAALLLFVSLILLGLPFFLAATSRKHYAYPVEIISVVLALLSILLSTLVACNSIPRSWSALAHSHGPIYLEEEEETSWTENILWVISIVELLAGVVVVLLIVSNHV